MKIILITLAALLLCFGCTKINGFLGVKNDWIGEQLLEDVIEAKLGLPAETIDFTP